MSSIQIKDQSSCTPQEVGTLWNGHPFSKLALIPYARPREFWFARESGTEKIVGRIGACISLQHPDRGLIGFFDLDESLNSLSAEGVTTELLDKACAFLLSHGAKEAIGPIHYNTWLPYRFQLPAQDSLRFSWEPTNPPHWPELWRKNGFEVEMTYASDGYGELERFAAKLKPSYERALQQGFRFDAIDHEHLIDREIPKLYHLSMAGFTDAHLFEPLPESLFRELYVPLADRNARGQLRHSCFIIAPDGKPVGFSFNFVQGEQLIMKTIAVLPEFRGKGLSNAAMYPGVDLASREGLRHWVAALVKTGAQSESYGQGFTREWRHEYALFRRKLSKI